MASAPIVQPRDLTAMEGVPLLEQGDRLSREEFERRYERMPNLKKAELIEGIVYMPSPVRVKKHAIPHVHLAGWLALYVAETPGVFVQTGGARPSIRLGERLREVKRRRTVGCLRWCGADTTRRL